MCARIGPQNAVIRGLCLVNIRGLTIYCHDGGIDTNALQSTGFTNILTLFDQQDYVVITELSSYMNAINLFLLKHIIIRHNQ